MRTFSKFLVLLWKNLLLKRRHWFMTILEIAVPVLLFVILAVIRGEIDPPLYKEIVTKNLETYQVTLDHQKQLTVNNFRSIHTTPEQNLSQANDLVSKVFMDRDVTRRNDGTEQGSANIFLCGLPPSPNIPDIPDFPDLPDFNFPGFNTTLLYVAPPEKRDEVRFFKLYFP